MLMKDKPLLQKVIDSRAEKLADRCFAALLPLANPGQEASSTGTHDWWTEPDASEAMTRELLVQAFKLALKLRKWLPLAQKCYEFFTVPLGEHPPTGTAQKPGQDPVEEDEIVHFCIMPGIVEYPSDMFLTEDSGPEALFSSDRTVVMASDEQRKAGRIISPTTVVTVD